MPYWIFKVAEQELYPDVPGEQYVYDNTHNMRVVREDVFLYLDKRKNYSFTATGTIRQVSERLPSVTESSRSPRVRNILTAHLQDIIWFKEPLTIAPSTVQGKKNRARLGIVDVNVLGWSQSMPSLSEPMYQKVLDLAEVENLVPLTEQNSDFSIPDNWGKTKVRRAVKRFSDPVMARSNSTCVVCGAKQVGIVEAAHLNPYASDKNNRANPQDGVCLCKFCHRALDLRLIAIAPDGSLLVAPSVTDQIAIHHFSQIPTERRLRWIQGVDSTFLELTVKWFHDNLSN